MSPLKMFAASLRSTTAEDEGRLVAAGVTTQTLYGGASVVAAVEATLNESAGTWQPTPGGTRLFVVPCGERGPNNIGWRWIEDLCVFDLATPSRWYLYRGTATVLNKDALDRAVHFDEVLRFNPNPLEWLKAGTDGMVRLDPNGLRLATLLAGIRRVLVDSPIQRVALLRELREDLPEPRLPEIRVRDAGEAEHAA